MVMARSPQPKDRSQRDPRAADEFAKIAKQHDVQEAWHCLAASQFYLDDRIDLAAHSLHMEGEAIDIRLGDVALDHLRNAAFGLQRGGVGYYCDSDFVHVDVGRVRRW